jgi:hypothetical protein
MLQLIVNELSLRPQFQDVEATRLSIEQFVAVLLDTVVCARGRRELLYPSDILRSDLCEGYTFGRWIAELPQGSSIATRVRSLISKGKKFDEVEMPNSPMIEYRWADNVAVGFGLALELRGLALSIAGENSWTQSHIEVLKIYIGIDDIEEVRELIHHASNPGHLLEFVDFLRDRLHRVPETGSEIWAHRRELFPNLEFCDSVEVDLSEIIGPDERHSCVVRAFEDLENYCLQWRPGEPFQIRRLGAASGESEPTLKKYGELRKFVCPDGEKRLFANHIKRGPWRVHFREDSKSRKFLVGYAGKHLSTVTG